VNAAMEGLENMAFVANAVSLVTYFLGNMNFSLTKSATTLTNFMGTAFLLPLVGGFISDTYLSRFKTCVLFGCMEVLVSFNRFLLNGINRDLLIYTIFE
jgi:peptide/histidine transporter 3/4